MEATPHRQHRLPPGHSLVPLLLPLVTGALGALTSDPLAPRSQVPAAAFLGDGDGGAWVFRVVHPAGQDSSSPANDSALLGASPRGPPARCLPLPASLPVCSRLGIGHAWLPNHLRHEHGDEVQAAARAWGRLLQTRCHPFLAWFFCLLLAPPCGLGRPPGPPPCRQFCEALEDACWSCLDGGQLPVACASLPAQEDGYCVFIGPAAGNWPAAALPTLPFCLAR